MKSIVKKIMAFKNVSPTKKYTLILSTIVIFSLFCEIFVFNFKFFSSIGSTPLNATPHFSGASMTSDTVKFKSDNASIEFDDINDKVKYIYFNPGEGNIANITISASDDANANMLSSPSRMVCGDVTSSQYIRLNYSGNIHDLRISVNDMNGVSINVSNIVLNSKIPITFSVIRFLFVIFTLALIYAIRPKSSLYKYKTNLHNGNQIIISVILIFVQAVCIWNMMHWNKPIISWATSASHHMQYYKLTEAFKDGHLYLDDVPSQELSDMDNPYDFGERCAKNVQAQWDEAFYNGKYYVYFGAVPVITIYLPYNLITGKTIPNYTVLFIICIFTMVGIMLLLWEIIKKWYNNTPFIVFALLSVVYGAISGIGYSVFKPDFYMIPPMMAVMFGVIGLALWLSSENQSGKTKVLINWRLAVGSTCIALIAGCRPQLLIVILLGVCLFWNTVFKDRLLFSKTGIKSTIAFCLPFVIIAAAVMWYNAARFDSPFDFGANYNLTTNDMTHRGIKLGRIGLGLFSYLFQPIVINAEFPFLHDFSVTTSYQGLTLSENMLGGIFMLFPILLIGLYGTFKRKQFNNAVAYNFVLVSMISVVILVILDTQMAGLLTRYFTDFVWFAMLAVSITVFAYYGIYKDDNAKKQKLTSIVLSLSILTLSLVFLRIFAHNEDPIRNNNPILYYTVQHLIAFWL